ncbi:MAG: PAS domain-containing protein [Thermoguttaceae bacterium]
MWLSPTKHLAFWATLLGLVLGAMAWLCVYEQSHDIVWQQALFAALVIILVLVAWRVRSAVIEHLRDVEGQQRVMLDAVPLCCLLRDHNFKLVMANAKAKELFGYDVEEILSPDLELSPEFQPCGRRSRELARDLVNEALKTGYKQFEWIHQDKSGTSFPAKVTLVRVWHNGHAAIAGYVRDMREEEAAQKNRDDAAAHSRNMLAAMPLMSSIWDENFQMIDCNQRYLDMLGLASKDDARRRFYETLPKLQPDGEDSVSAASQKFKATLETGFQQFEWVHQSLTGELIPTEVTLARTQIGEKRFVYGYVRDLRDVKTREQAMLMLDSVPMCCSVFDRDFNVIDCNREAVRTFQLTDKNEYARRFLELSPPTQPPFGEPTAVLVVKYLEEAFRDGSAKFAWEHCTLAGEPIPMDVTLVRHDLSGTPIVCSYARDLREEQRLSEKVTRIETIRAATNRVADTLMSRRFGSFTERIQQALFLAADATDMHRISIYENFVSDEGKQSFRRLYAWVSPLIQSCNHIAQCKKGMTYDETFPGWLGTLEAGQSITCNVEDIAGETERQFLAICGAVSVMAVPININGQFWGVARLVDCRRKREFMDGEIEVIEACVNLFASAIVDHVTQRELSRRNKLSVVINEIAENLMRSGKWGADNLSKTLRLLGETLQFDRATISISDDREGYAQCFNADQDGHVCTTYAAPDILPTDFELFSQNDIDPADFTAWGRAMYRGDAHHFTLSSVKKKTLQYLTSPVRNVVSLYTVPIHVNGSLWGIILLENCSQKPPLSPSEIEAIKSCAHLIAYAAIEQHSKVELATRNSELQIARDKADQLANVKTQFLTNMSHEIRTPMNAIVGMSRLLLEDSSAFLPRQRAYLADIVKSADMLLTLINDLLDFSKLEAGKMELVPKHYYLGELIDNIASSLGFVASGKNISLNVHKEAGIPAVLYGDDVRLKQVLWNTIGNAIKFTSVGSVTLAVSWEGKGDYLRFDVTDTGYQRNRHSQTLQQFYASRYAKHVTPQWNGVGVEYL